MNLCLMSCVLIPENDGDVVQGALDQCVLRVVFPLDSPPHHFFNVSVQEGPHPVGGLELLENITRASFV